ncbi:MAG: T9SS type A sorting domain-containing protein [Bacteroidia bacterium]|nr:T9SS type A sorting domain-containing protein [Bacteroidia bacterium]
MKKVLISYLISCACFLQAQVWTSLVDSIPIDGRPSFQCATIDSVNQVLYLGGLFCGINQYTTNAIIKYDGVNFDTLQQGIESDFPGWVSAQIRTMTMFQNKLYVFGDFTKAGKYYFRNMARWNGASWDSVDFKVPLYRSPKFEFIHNGMMYVSGLDSIGGIAVNGVGRYDGTNWSSIPENHNNTHGIDHIQYFKGKFFKAGRVTLASSDANLSYSDGTNWIPWVGVTGDAAKTITGMKVIDTLLWVYGRFNSIAGTNCKGLAAYNGKHWYGFGQGLGGSSYQTVLNIDKINGELYISGIYDKIEGLDNSIQPKLATSLAKFDGEKYCLISPPFDNYIYGTIKFKNNIYSYSANLKVGNDSVFGFLKYNGGYPTVCSQKITYSLSTIGLNEIINFGNIKIYPNPVRDRLVFQIDGFEGHNLSLELLNNMAEILKIQTFTGGQNEFDLTELSKGIYFLRVRDSQASKVFKVIKN